MTLLKNITIDNISIGNSHAPYVIAEVSANHNNKIETVMDMVKIAKVSGASAVKLQTYKPETMTLDCKSEDFLISKGLWAGRSLYDLYSEAHMPWDWFEEIFSFGKRLGITVFSTPFDQSAVDFLEDLNVPAYKIASFELTDLPLIKYVAQTKKPIILSTGLANLVEIQEALSAAYEAGCKQIALLHCVSGYPAPPEDYNLRTIKDLSDRFDVVVGLSDHTLGIEVSLAAVSLGASIIEKHFTLSRLSGGVDSAFSIEPSELTDLCRGVNTVWRSLGSINYEIKDSEKSNLNFRRSIYFVKDLKKGEIISEDCVRIIRPGFGLLPKYYDKIIGKKTQKDVKAGVKVSWEDVEI